MVDEWSIMADNGTYLDVYVLENWLHTQEKTVQNNTCHLERQMHCCLVAFVADDPQIDIGLMTFGC